MTSDDGLILYHHNNSVCAEKARMALHEKGLSWESREVDLTRGEQFDPEYLKLNPSAVVPTLVVGGRPVVESTLIVEYLDDAFPTPPLKPADPYERSRVRQFAKLCDEGLHQGVAVLSFAAAFMAHLVASAGGDPVARINRIVDLERRDRQLAVFHQGIEAPHVYRGIAAYEKAFRKIEAALGDGREWLGGTMFSLAEINLAPYLARLDYLDLLPVWTGDRPTVGAWFERIKTRPSFQDEVVRRVLPEELRAMRDGGRRVRDRVAAQHAAFVREVPLAA